MLHLTYQYATGGRIRGRPIVSAFKTLYALSEDRYLYCIDYSGNLMWRHNLKEGVSDSLSIGPDETVYVSLRNGSLIGINPKGNEVFKTFLVSPVRYGPVSASDGTIYAVLEDGRLISLSHKGRIRWSIKPPAGVSGPPVWNGFVLMLPLQNKTLCAYSPWGRETWSITFKGIPKVTILDNAGRAYSGTSEGSLYATDRFGVVLWEKAYSGQIEDIILGKDRFYILLGRNKIICTDLRGEPYWERETAFPVSYMLSVENGIVLLGERGQSEYCDLFGNILNKTAPLIRGAALFSARDNLVFGSGEDWNVYSWEQGVNLSGFWPQRGRDGTYRVYGFPAVKDSASLYETNPDYLYLKNLAEQPDPESKQQVLSDISGSIDSGDLEGKEQYILDILMRLATEAVLSPVYYNKLLVNDHPMIRLWAVNLIGKIGSFSIKPVLIQILRHEWNPSVLAEAVLTSGEIASDYDGSVTRALREIIDRGRSRNDPQVLLAVVAALGKITDYHGFLPDPGTLESLFKLVTGDYPRDVRKSALEVIRKMGK